MIDNYKLYCFTNLINGKQYIGITKQDVDKRWKNGTGYKKPTRIGSAIAKYGWDNFEHFILYQGIDKDTAIMFEQFLIEEFNTNNSKFGYNLTGGGEGTPELSEEARLRRIAILTGRPVSEETRRKLSEGNKGKHNPSAETRAKISAANKGKVMSAEARAKISKNCASRRPEVKAKIAKASLGRPNVNKGRKFTEEEKAILYATRRGKHLSDERKAEISAKLKAYHARKRQEEE